MGYSPIIPPTRQDDLLPYLNEEFVRVAQSFNNLQDGLWDINYTMPSRLKPGLIKYFDGTNANPLGTGLEGLYWYGLDGLWHFAGGSGGGGGGEVNTASNLGSGEGVYASKSGVDLRFKSLVAGSNITLTSDASTITINAASAPPAPVTSVAGKTGAVTLVKSDVGLSNVDNTSDAAKPISTATSTALAGKEPTIAAGTTSQYWRGDKSWQTLNPTAVGAEPAITAGTTAQYWRGDKTWQTLNKTAVGLANVDNTSDEDKPVSTATQTALNLKANLASPTFTGTVRIPHGLRIVGTSTGAGNFSSLAFYESDGTTRRGFVGDAGSNAAVYLGADSGSVLILQVAGTPQIQIDSAGSTFSGTVNIGGNDVDNTDSGWITMTLSGGWTSVSGRTAQYRRVGKIVYFRGAIQNTTFANNNTQFTALPVGYRPTQVCVMPATCGVFLASVPGAVICNNISTGAMIGFDGATASGTVYVCLDNYHHLI